MRVNKMNFHMKGFSLGLALKQRQNATRKSPTACCCVFGLLSCINNLDVPFLVVGSFVGLMKNYYSFHFFPGV